MHEWLKGLGWIIGPFIGWFLFKWLPEHPEYGEKILFYLIRLIPFIFSWKKRKIIEKEIQAYITEEIKSVNSESYGFKILPKGIKIEWTPKKKEEVIIEENEIIIRLGSRVNPCENFVDALLLYLSNSFMVNESIYLDPSLYEACKFHIAASMLKNRPKEYYQIFIDKYYKPALEKYKEILNFSEKLEIIERNGLFTVCFLPTLSFYTNQLISQRKAPSAQMRQEIIDFVDFVFNIANKREYERETGEEPPLTYSKNYLKISVILVARRELAKEFNYRPHLEMAKEKLKQSDILFIMGRGRNVDLAEIVALKLKRESLCEQINGASKFVFCPEENKKIQGICYAFKRKS
jgi:hypothetical protein